MSNPSQPSPTFDEIEAAAQRLLGQASRTPLLRNALLDKEVGGTVLVKPECLQRTGSFKFRGAFNRISCIAEAERHKGVVAYSSGNHAQGVAAAAALHGIPATIVMPQDAPSIKIENTRSYGAEVLLYDRFGESREEIGERLAKEKGATIVRPYDDPQIIAGQGTVGRELCQDAKAASLSIDQALVCCGGGGLIAGTSLAIKALSPQTDVYAVEPAAFDDTARSLESEERQENSKYARSICDALLAPTPGELTFSINKMLLSGGLRVTDDEVKSAMRFAVKVLKLVVEPGGAVALAALLAGKIPAQGKTTAIVISGGNVDPTMLSAILAA